MFFCRLVARCSQRTSTIKEKVSIVEIKSMQIVLPIIIDKFFFPTITHFCPIQFFFWSFYILIKVERFLLFFIVNESSSFRLFFECFIRNVLSKYVWTRSISTDTSASSVFWTLRPWKWLYAINCWSQSHSTGSGKKLPSNNNAFLQLNLQSESRRCSGPTNGTGFSNALTNKNNKYSLKLLNRCIYSHKIWLY